MAAAHAIETIRDLILDGYSISICCDRYPCTNWVKAAWSTWRAGAGSTGGSAAPIGRIAAPAAAASAPRSSCSRIRGRAPIPSGSAIIEDVNRPGRDPRAAEAPRSRRPAEGQLSVHHPHVAPGRARLARRQLASRAGPSGRRRGPASRRPRGRGGNQGARALPASRGLSVRISWECWSRSTSSATISARRISAPRSRGRSCASSIGYEQLELWRAKHELVVPREHLAQVRRTAAAIGEAHRLIALMVGREAEIRALLEAPAPQAPPPTPRSWPRRYLEIGRERLQAMVGRRASIDRLAQYRKTGREA
jgi:hypothetical protein